MAQCIANRRNCDQCQYRYKKGDPRYQDQGKCPQCGAPRARCKRPANKNFTVCKAHGGGSPIQGRPGGFGNAPHLFSRKDSLPHRLIERYQQALNDPELESLEKDLALSEAIIQDITSRLYQGETGQLWQELKSTKILYQQTQKALMRDPDSPELQDQLRSYHQRLMELIDQGSSDYMHHTDLLRWLEQKRKLVLTEFERKAKLGEMVHAEKFLAFTQAIGVIISAHIQNEDIITAIEEKTRRMLMPSTSDHRAKDEKRYTIRQPKEYLIER